MKMQKWFFIGGLLMLLFLAMIAGVTRALAGSNLVPGTHLGITTIAINANALKPTECEALNLTNIVIGSGKINGSNQSDLILGSAGADNISGKNGDDCIHGGGGDDSIDGGNGTDICIGGQGTDTFLYCETSVQ